MASTIGFNPEMNDYSIGVFRKMVIAAAACEHPLASKVCSQMCATERIPYWHFTGFSVCSDVRYWSTTRRPGPYQRGNLAVRDRATSPIGDLRLELRLADNLQHRKSFAASKLVCSKSLKRERLARSHLNDAFP